MTKSQVIEALQMGLKESITIIEHLEGDLNGYTQTDPAISACLEQLKRVLFYSKHVYDDDIVPNKSEHLN